MTRSHNNNNGNSNKKARGDTGRCGMSPIVMTVSGVFANVQTLIVHVKYGKKKKCVSEGFFLGTCIHRRVCSAGEVRPPRVSDSSRHFHGRHKQSHGRSTLCGTPERTPRECVGTAHTVVPGKRARPRKRGACQRAPHSPARGQAPSKAQPQGKGPGGERREPRRWGSPPIHALSWGSVFFPHAQQRKREH